MKQPTQTLYRKVGRKYVPVSAFWDCLGNHDQMQAGTFRLTYAYADGGKRYEYDVQPDTAGFVAAAQSDVEPVYKSARREILGAA